MKNLITIALGVALGIAGHVFVNRYLHTHSATVVVQRRAVVNNNDENTVKKAQNATQDAENAVNSAERK